MVISGTRILVMIIVTCCGFPWVAALIALDVLIPHWYRQWKIKRMIKQAMRQSNERNLNSGLVEKI